MKILAENLAAALAIAIRTQQSEDLKVRGPTFKSAQVAGWEQVLEALKQGDIVETGYTLNDPRLLQSLSPGMPRPTLEQLKSAMDWWNSFSPMIKQRYIAEYGARNFASAADIARFWVRQFPTTSAGTDFT